MLAVQLYLWHFIQQYYANYKHPRVQHFGSLHLLSIKQFTIKSDFPS